MQELQQHCPNVPDATIRALLGAFLFQGNDVFKTIRVLSGGEKNRVAMVKTLLQGANFLILDEPTNHLDIPSQDVLLDALKRYPGTILIVSHDHSFVQSLADTIIELKPHTLITFEGSYNEYRAHKKMLEAKNSLKDTQSAQKNPQNQTPINTLSSTHDSQKKIKKLESMILKKEQELSKINTGFINLTYGTPDYMQAIQKQKEIKKEIDNLTTEWEALTNTQ